MQETYGSLSQHQQGNRAYGVVSCLHTKTMNACDVSTIRDQKIIANLSAQSCDLGNPYNPPNPERLKVTPK